MALVRLEQFREENGNDERAPEFALDAGDRPR
jgi:hypothetical protein